MAVCRLVCVAVFSYLPVLSAERVADKRLLHEADSFLTRRHGARESEEKRTEAPLAALGVQETSSDTRMDVKVGLPKCSNGSLQLDGVYEVKDQEEVVVEGPSCRVMGSAQLLLSAPVRFQGNAVFAGQLSVKAVGDGKMQGPCITVHGNFTLQPEARLSLQGCQNQAEAGNGGCLHVEGDAELRGGHLQLNGCTASKGEGGGIVVGGALQSRTATIDAEGCHACYGGAVAANSMVISGGHVVIKESKADDDGGAIIATNMVVSGGNVTIGGSEAYGDGGAIHAENVIVSGGNVSIEESGAVKQGGAIKARNVNVSGGSVIIGKSEAYHGDGGAIYAYAGNMVVSGGNVSIEECTAQINGGAIIAEDMVVSGGNVTIGGSQAYGHGGAIYAGKMVVSGGNVTIEESKSKAYNGDGGAIYARSSMYVSGGSVTIKESKAPRYGGAIYTENVNVSGGSVSIQESEAETNGGAIYADNDMTVSGGSLTIKESTAKQDGGCIYTGAFDQFGGNVSLEGCKTENQGGGIYSKGTMTMDEMALLTIRDSQADKGGGVLANHGLNNKARQLHMLNCTATSHGGCFFLKDGAEFVAPLHVRNCKAAGTGGAIYAQGKLVAQQISCDHCHAPTAGCLQLESGEARVETMTLRTSSSLLPASSTVAAGAEAIVTLGRMDCRRGPGCTVAVAKMQLAQLLCQRGESRQSLADGDGAACHECPTGEIRLVAVDKEDASCAPCPLMGGLTIGCTSTELRVPPGYMVDFDRDVAGDLSAWYRCPNEMACRGGHFNASSVPGERAQELVPMCEEGYAGPGCTSCTEGHARADAAILWCIPCANWTTSPKQVVWYVSFFLLKNLALFVSAVVSVEGSGGKRAASATLLNQAMSFAAVAGVTMSGAMQTSTFKNDLDNAAQVALQMLAVPASVAQGQGSSDAGSSSMSGQCLLQLLKMDSSIHHVHLLMSLWPALLVAGLAAWKGGWLAAVVGSNVFLPAFVAGFGKYLVAFRLRPESEDEALHLDFLPPDPQMSSHVPLRIAAVLGAIVGFSALSVCSWIYAVRTRSPKEVRPHVAYLIQAYRQECAIWEVERLMRKVLLALIATVLPVTLSPALQMEAVTLVLIASLVAHLYFWPYQADEWNRAEIWLLIVSLTITGMTTCLIANDLHWAKSALTQRVLVFLICAIAGGICVAMLVAFSLAYLAERRQRAEAKKAEDTSAARPASPSKEAAAEPRVDATSTVDD